MRQLDLAAANVASVKWKSPSAVRGWLSSASRKALPLDFLSGWRLRPLLSLFNSFHFFMSTVLYVRCPLDMVHSSCERWRFLSSQGNQPRRRVWCWHGTSAGCRSKSVTSQEERIDLRPLTSEMHVQIVWLETSPNVWELQQWTQAQSSFRCSSK